jgi:uncharacterized repeat protein (TIGR03803 family)
MKTSNRNLFLLPVLTAGLALALAPAARVEAQTFTPLYSFTGLGGGGGSTNRDGAYPCGGLVISGSMVYGTANAGGTNGFGTVFGLNDGGFNFENLHNFADSSKDGGSPLDGLVISGNTVFGTAYDGGAAGNGTIFRVNTDGTGFTNLHSFGGLANNPVGVGTNGDGASPTAGLILAGNVLYGTAADGGTNGMGTVFALHTDGTSFTNLHNFTSGSDGANPNAGLVLSGNTLYGTAELGGNYGMGTVFAVSTNGGTVNSLHSFSQASDGSHPLAGLVLSGNTLFGTASAGGSGGSGTVFEIATSGGGFRNLYSFTATNGSPATNNDGAHPVAGLVRSANNLYGTTAAGGASGYGTLFGLTTNGTGFNALYTFTNGTDGGNPQAGLLLSGNTLYGTATNGGSSNSGTVFMLVVPGLGASDQFTLTPSVSVSPATVTFTTPSYDSEGNAISSWNWTFGDGSTSTAQNPSHVYTGAGTFSPTLEVVNSYGFEISATGPSLEVFAPTSIAFTATPTNGTAPLTISFTSPAVDSASNAIDSWYWIFGDGATSAAQNPTHKYTVSGNYTPVLMATNSNVLPVNSSGPPVAVYPANFAFTAVPTTGAVPLTVNFASPSADNEGHAISSWNWSFGDGGTSAAQNPTHIYTTAGTYVPALMATNSVGIPITGFGPPYITPTNTAVASGLVLNGGFGTGQFSDWTTNASPGNSMNFFVDNGSGTGITPQSGEYLVALGSIGSLSYLSQTLATSPGSLYLLSLWLYSSNTPEGQPNTNNQFLVSWNGTNLWDETNIPVTGWTNLQFFVTATGAATVLQFGFQDDPWYLGLDDVSVVSAQPGIGGVGLSGTNLVINGLNGFSNQTYYVLMSTNVTLPLSKWTTVATNVPGASGNFAITVKKPVTSGAAQRYYIILFQ